MSHSLNGVTPRVSVIIPNFNQSTNILKESIDSICAQSFKDFECILIDESTDLKKSEECRRLCDRDVRFIYLKPKKHLGLASSLNYGFSVARGEYIARFDSDDICDPLRLEKQVIFLDQNTNIGVVGSSIQVIDLNGYVLTFRDYPNIHSEIERKFVYTNSLAHPAVMLRKNVIESEQGPYNGDFQYSEDLELWLRLLTKGVKFANLPDRLIHYRQSSPYRNKKNWEFNIRARRMYLLAPYKTQKILVLGLLKIWTFLPRSMQELIYKKFIFC